MANQLQVNCKASAKQLQINDKPENGKHKAMLHHLNCKQQLMCHQW